MALAVALVLAGIAVGLLLVYGADVAAGYGNEDGQGFLPFDHMARGLGLGMPALVLPFIAFAIARKEPSLGLGALIVASGILIMAGGAAVVGTAAPAEAAESGRDAVAEAIPLLAAGAVQVGLGAIKLKKSA